MGHAKTIARNSLWSLADSLLGMVNSFACSVAVARAMGPEQLGYYNIVTWMASMAGWIAAFGIPAATRTFTAEAMGRGDHACAILILLLEKRGQLRSGRGRSRGMFRSTPKSRHYRVCSR